jgi:hypothetical protein
LRDQGVDQGCRHAGIPESADHHGGAVVDVGDGTLERFKCFINHVYALSVRRRGGALEFMVPMFDNRTNDRLPFTQCIGTIVGRSRKKTSRVTPACIKIPP